MALILDGTEGITSSGGTNVLQDDAVITANIADGAVSDAKIADGAVTAAKLAAGAVPAPSTADVLSATAGASYGDVGTYIIALDPSTTILGEVQEAGGTVAGSGLRRPTNNSNVAAYGGVTTANSTSLGLSGTWRRLMSMRNFTLDNAHIGGFYLRIS